MTFDSSKIKAIIVAILAIFAALYLGITAATAQFETIAWVVGALTLAGCLLLGKNIWMLIPFLGSLHLTLMIPGRPDTLLVAQCLVIGFSLLMFLTRKLPFHLRFSEIEWWIALFFLCVLQAYLRNPVGLNMFGGDQIGGRPYFIFVLALLTALILCGMQVPATQLRTALRLSILGGVLNFAIGLLGFIWAPFGYWFGMASGQAGAPDVQQQAVDTSRATRVEFVRVLSKTLALTVSSFRDPLTAMFSIRWAPLVLFSLALAAASGFRNVVAAIGLTYLVGIFYRGGIIPVIASSIAAGLGLALLALVNLAAPLPPNIQRSLSFLPGTWDESYVLSSKSSTDWRVEMWKEVLFTDRWIENKIFGDGLGFSARELALQGQMQEMKRTTAMGMSGFDAAREYVLINGDYHSGPVSAVRTIGYVGLAVMFLFQLRLAVRAHRQIQRCRGTDWFPIALFFGIPIIWYPVFFAFIFGGFGLDGIAILMNAGILRLLENNLPLPSYSSTRRSLALPISQANRQLPHSV
jgi:hypothetical protein